MQKIKDLWFNLSDKIRFFIVGSFNAGVQYLLFIILVKILGEQAYQLSLILSWVFSSIVSYTTQRLLVFNVKGNIIKQYLKCLTTWMFSYAINAVLLEILVKLSVNVFLAQFVATFITAVFTYIMFKVFAFRKRGKSGVNQG